MSFRRNEPPKKPPIPKSIFDPIVDSNEPAGMTYNWIGIGSTLGFIHDYSPILRIGAPGKSEMSLLMNSKLLSGRNFRLKYAENILAFEKVGRRDWEGKWISGTGPEIKLMLPGGANTLRAAFLTQVHTKVTIGACEFLFCNKRGLTFCDMKQLTLSYIFEPWKDNDIKDGVRWISKVVRPDKWEFEPLLVVGLPMLAMHIWGPAELTLDWMHSEPYA